MPSEPVAVEFVACSDPLVSVVIPAHGHWQYTNAALRALAASLDASIQTEIVVVDDASTDRTPEMLSRCRGAHVVRLESNVGFGAACNAGAAAARGTFIAFLNNDTIVTENWLRPLVSMLQSNDTVAAVVSQLRYPDNRVAEAGGVIWRDGRGSNYGRGDDPNDWRYQSARDVDYGSAASLMIRAGAFRDAGGFSAEFAPAYYEDADLCFTLRERGLRVVYEPRSVVYHAEGVSFGSNAKPEARALQERNRRVFAAKWAHRLSEHREPDVAEIDAAARRLTGKRTVLVVDDHVPFTDRDAGSRRIFALIELMHRCGWHVVFGSLDPMAYEPYAGALRAGGADVMLGFGAASLRELARESIRIDAAWLCRPQAMQLLAPVRQHTGAKIAYDTVDLYYERLAGEERVSGRHTGWQRVQQNELAAARDVDVTVTTSSRDAELLRSAGIGNARVVPIVEAIPPQGAPGWESRGGIVFLGNYAHAPNVDAAHWLCTDIMPLVRRELPGIALTLAGTDPTRAVRALASSDVTVTGYVPDAAAVLATARVFVAPLRFGAGMKGKVVYALAHGLPAVATPVAAEGIFEPDEWDAIGSTPEELAVHIVRMHEDRALWEAASARGLAIAQRFTPESVRASLENVLALLD